MTECPCLHEAENGEDQGAFGSESIEDQGGPDKDIGMLAKHVQ